MSWYTKPAIGIFMAMIFNSQATAVSPLNRTLLCDPEIIRSTDGVIKNYDWEILADWQLAISEEKDKFVVSGARARVATDGDFDLPGDVLELLKASDKVAHIITWNISVKHDEECNRFLAVSSK